MDWVIIIGLFVLGWLLGALVNYLSDVLPETRRFTPVCCPNCQVTRPLKDYLLLCPCRQCHTPRAIRAWVVQAASIGILVAGWINPSPRLEYWMSVLLLTYFGVVTVIDIERRLILHPVSAVGAVIGLGIGLYLHGPVPTLLGGLGGCALMVGLYLLGWLIAKIMGRLRGQEIEEDALGFGDIILGTILGFMLGWPGIIAGVFYTVFIAGAGSLLVILWQVIRGRYQAFTAVAFGPYMILAALLLLYGPKSV